MCINFFKILYRPHTFEHGPTFFNKDVSHIKLSRMCSVLKTFSVQAILKHEITRVWSCRPREQTELKLEQS